MAYTQTLTVRFDDVDYAQIVYFPRLFGYCHWVFEDFFKGAVGVSYAEMLGKRRVGFPTVNAKADFRHPFRFGDPVRVVMETVKLGKSSLTSRYRLHHGPSERIGAEVELTTVCVSMDTFKPLPFPEDVRQAFLNHLVNYQTG